MGPTVPRIPLDQLLLLHEIAEICLLKKMVTG